MISDRSARARAAPVASDDRRDRAMPTRRAAERAGKPDEANQANMTH